MPWTKFSVVVTQHPCREIRCTMGHVPTGAGTRRKRASPPFVRDALNRNVGRPSSGRSCRAARLSRRALGQEPVVGAADASIEVVAGRPAEVVQLQHVKHPLRPTTRAIWLPDRRRSHSTTSITVFSRVTDFVDPHLDDEHRCLRNLLEIIDHVRSGLASIIAAVLCSEMQQIARLDRCEPRALAARLSVRHVGVG